MSAPMTPPLTPLTPPLTQCWSDTDPVFGAPSDCTSTDCDEPTAMDCSLPVSQTFPPSSGSSDLVLVSSDMVLFYVNSAILRRACPGLFDWIQPVICAGIDDSHAKSDVQDGLPLAFMPEEEGVLDLVLHAAYGLCLMDRYVDIPRLEEATDALLNRYGGRVPPLLSPGCPLFTAIVEQAERRPLDAYILAAKSDLEQLAVACSARMLSYPLHDLTESAAQLMGPHFLARLFNLHMRRTDALRALLAEPPEPHAPSYMCAESQMKTLQRAWSLAAAAVFVDARADLSEFKLESAFRPLLGRLSCAQCYEALSKHVADVVCKWAMVKATI